jgi:hypothetical protein
MGSTRLGDSLPENSFQTVMHLYDIRRWMKSQKKKTVSVNICHAVFALLDFLTLEAGIDRLSKNVIAEFPFYSA